MPFFQLAELIKATVHTHRIHETQRASYSKGADLQVTAELKFLKIIYLSIISFAVCSTSNRSCSSVGRSAGLLIRRVWVRFRDVGTVSLYFNFFTAPRRAAGPVAP